MSRTVARGIALTGLALIGVAVVLLWSAGPDGDGTAGAVVLATGLVLLAAGNGERAARPPDDPARALPHRPWRARLTGWLLVPGLVGMLVAIALLPVVEGATFAWLFAAGGVALVACGFLLGGRLSLTGGGAAPYHYRGLSDPSGSSSGGGGSRRSGGGSFGGSSRRGGGRF
ncbi:hypothetical protein ACI797_17470 [Geodermatophilus sp. SYSU D00691]